MATNDFTKRYLERRRELGLSNGQTTTQQTPGRTQITTPASANSNASNPASQGTARQESGNSYTSGYLAKRRELMGGGVTGGQTRPSATLPSIPSLSSSLRRFTPTQLLQDVLKQSETTRPAGGQTTTPTETMSSADMSARLDELRELRDTAEADRNEARTVLTGVNRYGTQAQREEWNSKLEQAEADYSRYDQEYNELLDRYYQTENEEKRTSLQQDEAMSGQYLSAQDIQSDMDKVSAVMAYTVTHDGDAAQVEEYKQYLFDKYGLDQKAVDQYAISGAGGAYVPRTDGGYNNIYELYLELQEKKENAVSTLSEGGYDYERMTGYEDMLEDAAQYREDMEEWQEYAREHPILSSVDTLLTAPFQGFDFLRVMGQNIGHSDRDDPENYVPMNSYDMELTNYINAVRQTVSEEIEGATNWEIFDQNVAAFLYQTGMSIGDSSLNLLAFGPTGALVVGSSTAAANQAKDIIDRGGSKEQAFMGGMAAGAFEAIFEKVSIDNLLATKSVTGWKSWLKETAKQAGIEASEETFTEIANILADAAIMGDNSNYDVAVAEYVAQGMSQEDAERQAFFDLIGQVVQAGVGGAISGGVMGGAVNGVNGMANAAYNRYNQQLVQENDVKNAPILETNPQEGPVQSQNEGEIDSSIPEATRQAVEMLVRGEEISGNQAARIAESEEAVALLSRLTGEEVNTDAPISRVKSDIRALARREGRTSGEAGVNSRATQNVAQTQEQQNAERPTAQRAYDILRVQQAATTLGESGSRALTAAYDGSVDAGSFYAGFAAYYEAGVSGMDMGRVRSEYAQDLTEAQRYAAYTAGQNDAAASLQREREGVQFATVYGDEAGFIPSEHSRNLSQDTVRFYNALGRATGTKITVTAATGEGGANGWYSNGTVYIAADAESAGSVVAKHEITHRLQEIAPEAYRTYRDYAVNAMAERDGSTATLVERYKARYAQSGVNLTTEQAMDEIAADFTEALTVDPSRFDTLAQEHRSVARRVLDALRDFISKVKALFKGRSDQDRAAMSEYGVSMETLERAARLWEETLRAGQAQVSTMTEAQQRVEFSDVNTRYSLREKEPPKKTGVAYKVFFAKNGELYPPMVANPGGEGTPVGVWLDADVGQAAPPSKTGRAQVQAGGRGTNAAKGSLAFRPGWHLGDIPLAKQFARKNPATGVKDLFPADFVWAECEYAMDVDYQEEAMSYGYTENGKFRHSYAGLPKLPTDGYYRYRTNPNPDTVPWIITGAMRVRRILTDAETDAICREAGVEPMQRQGGPLDEAGLERLGLEAGDVTGNTRFSMKSAVEDNGTLLALHNLTEDKLRSALRLGGFPMPSIAVTRADIPHTNFGDITLVMSRQTVDPRANRRNTVYSADAWTPTFPAIEYEADPQAERRISRRIGELSAQVDPFFRDDLRRVQYGLDDYLNRHGGEEGLARWAMDNYGLKAAYLEEQGQHIAAVTTQREADRGYNMDRAEQYQAVADVLGTTDPEAIGSMNLKELRDQHGEALERAYPGMTKSALRMSGVLRQVQAYLEGRDSEPTYEAVTDSAATRRAVDNALDQAGYERWVRELYSGIEAASGVYNNKERFTPSGNRRSFQQTHYPVTLDNITKAMAGQNNGDSRNVSGFYGIKSLRAGMAERFKSIADMHRLEGRLQNLTQEEADAISNALDSRLSSIMEELAEKSPGGGRRYDYMQMDAIGNILMEIADGGNYTIDSIMRRLNEEYHYHVGNELAAKIRDLLFDVSQMPVNLFEAKPERSVHFDEVLAAVLPDNVGSGLSDDLLAAGVGQVLTYEEGNDADRLAKANSVEGARFSLKPTDSRGRELSEEQRRYFQGSKITDADGRLLVLYHGTTAYGEITKFRRGRSGWLGPGIYLASRQADAKRYADAMGEGNGQLYELYANATNPLVVTEGNPVPEILRAAYGRDSVYRSRSAKQGNDAQIITTADIKKLQSKGYDGIRWDFGGSTEVSVFSPEQIKRVDNLTPSGSQDVRYSLKAEDSQGRELTQEQQEFFRDSKAVDNQGRLLVLYHGTASNFTVFDRERITQNYPNNIGDLGFYFTPYQTDARGYAGNAAGRVGGGSVMQVYLNLTNPLVVEDDGWGGAANQADARHSELLRWARAGGHDGIIVRSTDFEMEDGEYDAIYVAFSPEQIKNTDNLNPTSDPDIRRSIKGGDILRQNAALQEENSLLRERVEYWRGQTRRTERVTTDKKAVERAARELIRAYNSSLETTEIDGDLQSLYDYIASGRDGSDELTYTEARRRSDAIARKLVDSAAVLEDDAYRDYADLRSYLRSTPLSISAEDSHDIADFGDFRRRNFGRMTIRSGPTNIDQVYQEMSDMWPEFFDETRESTPSDQLVHIAEVLDGIYRVTERNPFSGYFDAAVTDASNEIMERFFDLPQTRPTFADRQARKLDDAKAAGRRRLAEQRERSDARLNELRQQNRERVQRAIQRERETRARQIDRLKTRYAARDAAGRERRSARELRARISRHVADLSRRLLRPSDKQHIPEQLRTAVAAMLDAINLESVYTVDPETGRRRKGGNGDPTKRTEAFRALRQAYANITKDGADYTLIIDPDLMDNLTELEAMRDAPLAEMGTAQLSTIWATVRAVEASIRTANRMLGESRFRTISQVAEGIRNDNIMRQDRGDYRGILGKVDRLVNLDMLTPQGYFHRMGPTGDALFRMLRSAQDRHIEIMRSAQEATRDIIGSVDTTQLERETHTFDVDGQKLTMSTAQIMALYELMKRQQAQEHIFTGGIRPEAVRTGRGLRENRRADAVHVTVEDLAEITGVLTEEQVKIADALQKYMGGQLAELGNQASMEVYGYRKFTEPNYFPIQVDRNQTQRDIAKEAQAQTIAGRGFTKGTVPRANNAVMVGSIFDIFASHVNDMATYSAWLPTMENVRRIRDFTFRDSEGNRTGTVKSVIERVFGRNGNAYLNKLVDDLNQGVRTAGSGNFMDSIVGNYKAAAVAANLRVIAQQPTAILRALNTMDAKYLLAGTVRRGDWEKVMKYAPIARWKDWGYFDINTGRQMKDVLLGSSTRLEKLRQAGMAGAGKADSIAWARLWNAVEAETKDRRPGLKPGTDAFYRAVGDRFSEIVDQTQVVDGILQRSQIMRSSDALTKISTSFMGEPTKSYNMFVNAVYDLRHATSQQGRSRAKRALARTTTALAVSFTVNAIMQSLVDALRDDDKETDYWEKVFQAFTGFTGDEETVLDYWNSFWSGNLEASYNPLAYMPYFKDLVSIAQGYDVTRMDMEAIEKVWSAFTNMRSALSGEGRYSIAGASANMLAEVARLFGLPVANIKRDVQAVATTAAIETDNYLMQYRMDKALLNIGYQGNRSGFMDILYAASVNDPEAYEIIYEDMVASGITEDQIRTAMESRMKEDQGVESVDELSRRYLTPNQERTYDRLYGQVSSSPVWRAASPEQREAVEEDIYDLTTGTDAGVKLQEKSTAGAAYGITEADYLLYLAAREIADGENEDPEKRNGSIDQAEAQAAIDMLTGLSDEGRAYLWQSTNKGWSEEKNPYR